MLTGRPLPIAGIPFAVGKRSLRPNVANVFGAV